MLTVAIAGLIVASVIVAILDHLRKEADLDRRWDEIAYAWSAPERKWDEDWGWED